MLNFSSGSLLLRNLIMISPRARKEYNSLDTSIKSAASTWRVLATLQEPNSMELSRPFSATICISMTRIDRISFDAERPHSPVQELLQSQPLSRVIVHHCIEFRRSCRVENKRQSPSSCGRYTRSSPKCDNKRLWATVKIGSPRTSSADACQASQSSRRLLPGDE